MATLLDSVFLRYIAVIAGTVLWDVGAVLQKRAVDRLPRTGLKVSALVTSAAWMTGLVVTAVGWGAYVFAIDGIPVSAARMVSGGSYVVLALFSPLFLRTPLKRAEWLAVILVSAGIVLLGLEEKAVGTATGVIASAGRAAAGIACVAAVSAALLFLRRPAVGRGSRPLVKPLIAFAALSGLLSSVGDLLVKVVLSLARAAGSAAPLIAPLCLASAGLIASYLSGFYMLSRAYQAGTVIGGVVISDFFARLGAMFLGAVVLSEPLLGVGSMGPLRLVGFLAVLVGSLLLGRFGDGGRAEKRAQTADL